MNDKRELENVGYVPPGSGLSIVLILLIVCALTPIVKAFRRLRKRMSDSGEVDDR